MFYIRQNYRVLDTGVISHIVKSRLENKERDELLVCDRKYLRCIWTSLFLELLDFLYPFLKAKKKLQK